jgi:endonuclease/exonuclease/phosphatase (EEP) superfamily protein YafD
MTSRWFQEHRRVTIFSLCLSVAVLAAVYTLVGDRTVWGEWIAVAPPVLWGILLLPSVVRLRSWLLLAAVAAFVLLASEWPRLGVSASAPSGTLRIVTWNIGAGNRGWVDAVETLDPDIVLVQEGMKPARIQEGFHWYGTLDPGVLSRFPAEVLPTESIGPWTDPQLLLMDIDGRKVLVANVRMMLPSVVIQIVDPFQEKPLKNHRIRVEQYEKLARLLKTTAERTDADAILLAGDFNIPGHMPSLEPFRIFLRDAWTVAGSGRGETVPEFLPLTRIDQIWLSPEIQPVSVRVVKLDGSDHRAVLAEVRVLSE